MIKASASKAEREKEKNPFSQLDALLYFSLNFFNICPSHSCFGSVAAPIHGRALVELSEP